MSTTCHPDSSASSHRSLWQGFSRAIRHQDTPRFFRHFLGKPPRALAALQPRLAIAVDCSRRIVISNLDIPSMEISDLLEIHVDRGSGFSFLTLCSFGGAIDITPFPSLPSIWTYKAMYRVAGCPTGRWSEPLPVNVGLLG